MRFALPEHSAAIPETTTTPSRRTVLRGAAAAAWAVPVITVAKPTFAAAISSVAPPPVVIPTNPATPSGLRVVSNQGVEATLFVFYGGGYLPAGSTIWFDYAVHKQTTLTASALAVSAGWVVVSVLPSPTATSESNVYRFTMQAAGEVPASPLVFTMRPVDTGNTAATNPQVTLHIKPAGQTEITHDLTWLSK